MSRDINYDGTYSKSERAPLLAEDESNKSFYRRVVQPTCAEFVGTTLFVFLGTMTVFSGDLTKVGLTHGFMIALLIMGLGGISGGHFNPAVTLGVALSRGMPPTLAPWYWAAQLLGGMTGAAFTRAVLPSTDYNLTSGGGHTLGPEVSSGWAILIEVLLTTILVMTVILTAVNERTKSEYAPLAIGFAVAVDIMAGGALTGASMNPARSFGPAVVANPVVPVNLWKYHYVYWVGPLLGAVVAALVARLFR